MHTLHLDSTPLDTHPRLFAILLVSILRLVSILLVSILHLVSIHLEAIRLNTEVVLRLRILEATLRKVDTRLKVDTLNRAPTLRKAAILHKVVTRHRAVTRHQVATLRIIKASIKETIFFIKHYCQCDDASLCFQLFLFYIIKLS